MAPIRIPEGSVFIARGDGVAAALLDAADRIGADRKWDIRTTQGGYHVKQEVADEYLAGLPEAPEPEDVPDDDPTGDGPDEDRAYPEGDPEAAWTKAQILAWAADQTPPVELEDGATKAVWLDQISN